MSREGPVTDWNAKDVIRKFFRHHERVGTQGRATKNERMDLRHLPAVRSSRTEEKAKGLARSMDKFLITDIQKHGPKVVTALCARAFWVYKRDFFGAAQHYGLLNF
ncbi:hypothetical protein PROFUN_01736 [Planoprotostelium fungivorum]|uniref:Uncharacterized protein n=1 Tax=Planoprotostelium fungivorum TaxID=1890364 RepID=A0A2P6MWC8_9EUKA|nr:hypothetical protein PROFUN_01736 [Planoprotostelium fungivorum]